MLRILQILLHKSYKLGLHRSQKCYSEINL